jgi:hypothetical protein
MHDTTFYQMHQFSVNHPERRPGEKWLTNDAVGENYTYRDLKTLRVGEIAYDAAGEAVAGLQPIFVTEAEFNRLMRESAEETARNNDVCDLG